MPMNREEYPDNWEWISKQAIADASNKCELCFAPNGINVCMGQNDIDSNEYPWRYPTETDVADECKMVKIVLTVHHINGNKMDNRKQNLLVSCQRCHLRLDLLKHMDNRKKNKIINQTKLLL